MASLAPSGETLASRTKKMRIGNEEPAVGRTIVRKAFDELSFMSPVISPLRRLMRP